MKPWKKDYMQISMPEEKLVKVDQNLNQLFQKKLTKIWEKVFLSDSKTFF